ncbi:RBBP9/YdeN family alpha/beta hydrolase [Arthrobacter sp. H41]|uniref:RBBP9/YdeN family alpha/beta hydrolase n=1 Tax=Arthrobacter sp. H41 TaxID=1312978 RepID=UPI0004B1178B|nr:alpha/beta hydrolase [Arthrobacter sp. H41]
MKQLRIFVIPGYQAAPGDHWFPWMERTFGQGDSTVEVLHLPTPQEPMPGPWVETIEAAVHRPDESTVLVCHSLGCIAALRYLDTLAGSWSLHGLILVAGFEERVPELPLLDPFTALPVDAPALARHITHRTVFASDNDPVVPSGLTRALAERLSASLVEVHDAGHFLGSDGYGEFPELGTRLAGILEENPRQENRGSDGALPARVMP